ncbi:site-specific integrase [Methanoregula formicica]|uniref:Site-specific recombinase XerD n=1 Tax=Methanoregula formicica (strain DSM 22288 / NBRC 105244 / SMSP) TaxID=593750 RepID=L0H9F0_METFS|nr:site-specific integrase [Methanoregula formicica]AGB01367.1 site-specific recombinase XerD [Methanoregula formicica SMSP]
MTDFHYGKAEYGDRSIQSAIERNELSENDAKIILEFVGELVALQGISLSRRNNLIFSLVFWRRFLPQYRDATMTDLVQAIGDARIAKNQRGEPYKQNTLHDHITLIKRFYTWLIENQYTHVSVTPAGIKRIKPPPVQRVTHSPDEILTKAEINKMVKTTKNPMYRAVVCMLYEGGFRAKEIGTLTWSQVSFDQYGLAVRTDLKTRIPRYIRLIKSKKYLNAWKRIYPGNPSGKNLVFLNNDGNPLSHNVLSRQVRIIGQQSGIMKKVTLHIFRHSRITHLIKMGVREDVIKLMMWGSTDTEMLQTYSHISNKDISEIVRQMEGIKLKPLTEDRTLAPRQCKYCWEINPPMFNYCGKCGRELKRPDGSNDKKKEEKLFP